MLVDEAEVIIKGGKGGAGKVSFYRPPQKGPDGGNGGRGGDVYLNVTSDLTALRPFTTVRTIAGGNGENGESNRKFGSDGKDREINVPAGSVVTNKETGEEFFLNEVGQKMRVAKGGLGGRGNFEFRSSRNTTPEYAQPGLPGEEKKLLIQLKLIADFGLIGLPNAGKSSILNELTAASAKVANYPFTTLEPNLGVLSTPGSQGSSFILADIPGLIEGASLGKGLGIKFLKHIEKTKVLLHCIASDTKDVLEDYKTILQELEKYNPEIVKKKEIIILTKSDVVSPDVLLKQKEKLQNLNREIVVVSIYDYDSIEKLKSFLKQLLNS